MKKDQVHKMAQGDTALTLSRKWPPACHVGSRLSDVWLLADGSTLPRHGQGKPVRKVDDVLSIRVHDPHRYPPRRRSHLSFRLHPHLRRARPPSPGRGHRLSHGKAGEDPSARCSTAREPGARDAPLVEKAKRFDGDGPVGFLVVRSPRRLA